MFVGEARSLPLSGAPEIFECDAFQSFTGKAYYRLNDVTILQHPSCLRKSVNYGHKSFYSTVLRWQNFKTIIFAIDAQAQ
jgi:hypothetical protein